MKRSYLSIATTMMALGVSVLLCTGCGGSSSGSSSSGGSTSSGGSSSGGTSGGGTSGGGTSGGGTSGGGSGSNITVSVYGAGENFDKAVYQTEDGSWQALNLTKNGDVWTGSFSANDRYGVAINCENNGNSDVKLYHLTRSETTHVVDSCSDSDEQSGLVSFTVNGNVDPGLGAMMAVVNNEGNFDQIDSGEYNVTARLLPGMQDIVVGVGDESSILAAKVARDVNVADGGSTTVNINQADQLAPKAFTTSNVPAGFEGVSAIFYLAKGMYFAGPIGPIDQDSTSYRPVSGFDANLGDLYLATSEYSNANEDLFSVEAFAGGEHNITLPAPWQSGSLTVEEKSHPIVKGLNRSEDDILAYSVDYTVGTLSYDATISKGWLGSKSDYALPDLSAQLGYSSPQAGSQGEIDIEADFGNIDTNDLDDSRGIYSFIKKSGDYVRSAGVNANYTVEDGNLSLPQ